MLRCPVRLFLFFCLVASAFAEDNTKAKSSWLGDWGGYFGNYGTIALSLHDQGNGAGLPTSAEVWWLFDQLRPTRIHVEGNRLFIDITDNKGGAAPGLAFDLTEQGTLRLAGYGALAPLDPIYASVELAHAQPRRNRYSRYRITDFGATAGEYAKWHQSDELKPLPADWPAGVAAPLLRLFARDDHILLRVAALPSLPEADLAMVYAWTKEKSNWSISPGILQRCVARNPSAPLPVLTELWNQPENSDLWIVAAQNPRAPVEWRAGLIDRVLSGSEKVQNRTLWQGDGPPELYLKLIKQKPALRERIASNRVMPAAVYECLARDYPKETSANLADNPAVPPALLDRLAGSADPQLRQRLIGNPSLPTAMRARLVRQILDQIKPADFRQFVYDRDATPEFLLRCSADLDPDIRTSVARNQSTPEPLLLTLAEDVSRNVATAARESLQKRFPASFAGHSAGFTPIESRPAEVSLYKQFESAVTRGDLPEIKRFAAYYGERGELEDRLDRTALYVIQGGYHPAVMDFYLTQGYDRYGGALARLAGQCGGNPEWMSYFKKHNAFARNYAGRAYSAALESGKPENLAGLLVAKIDPNQPDGQSQTVLHRAVLLHDLPTISALLHAGANPALYDARGKTPLDYAVLTKFIPAIRLLDRQHRYSAMIESFTKEFPPAPDSPFLGGWTNNKDGFSTMVIQLDGDGSGRIGVALIGGLLAWREVSPTEAVTFLFNDKGEVEKSLIIKLHLDPTGKQLTFEPPKGEAQRMIRLVR